MDSSGLNLQESRLVQPPEPVPSGLAGVGIYHLSNAYDLRAVDVSSDGQVVAFTGFRDCIGDLALCSKGADGYVTTITSSSGCQDYPGKLRLSANGKWAFGGGTGEPHYSAVYGHLVNLTTGEQIPQTSLSVGVFQVATSGRPIANDGTAVFSDYEAVVILQGTQTIRRIPTQNHDEPIDAVIDPSAQTIVYSVSANIGSNGVVSPNGPKSIHIADIATGESTMIAPDGYAPSLSDDGSTVLYLSDRDGPPQAWLIQTDGSGDRQLTHDTLGITQAILSGDGSVAYAVTLGGQLLSISIVTGDVQELIPRTPFINPRQLIARGRLDTLKGAGLVESAVTATPPLPYSLDSLQITIQGKRTLISSIQPGAITVLTPPDVTATPFIGPGPSIGPGASLQLDAASNSPFDGPITQVMIVDYRPEFLLQQPPRSMNPYMVAVHEDWSAMVTPDSPARPGEVLHAYAVGLGPTDPAVPYGAAAPAEEPLARLVTRYQCSEKSKELQTLFQGLAPNSAGLYQIDWRVPLETPEGDLVIFCGSSGSPLRLAGTAPVALGIKEVMRAFKDSSSSPVFVRSAQ